MIKRETWHMAVSHLQTLPAGQQGNRRNRLPTQKHTHRKHTDENEENNGPTPPDLGRGFRTLTHGTLPHWSAVETNKELSSSKREEILGEKPLCFNIFN